MTHFKRNRKIRIVCDASKKGLGTVLQQQQENQEGKPVSFASRFLTDFEAKYSINELELLAIVWAIEHFKNYKYGVKFQIISDHKTLASVLKPNRGNKTFSSRLTRWVDRLLPFEFKITHAPGRVLGFADYLSRHPSEIKGNTVKVEKLWNDWFTVIAITKSNAISEKEATWTNSMKLLRAPESVLEVKSKQSERQAKMARKYEGNEPIKSLENQIRERNRKITAANKNVKTSQVDKMSKFTQIATSENKKMTDSYLPANYQADKMLQKVISLVKSRGGAKISRLPAPWREKVNSLSIDEKGLLYMDERLVIPASLRASIMSSVHYGHLGRDTMLRHTSDIWWPKIHREVINTAKCCEQCSLTGKSVKPLKRQNQFGEMPKSVEPNEEIALDFAGSFQNAEYGKNTC